MVWPVMVEIVTVAPIGASLMIRLFVGKTDEIDHLWPIQTDHCWPIEIDHLRPE
jgi:hypothetical protein